MQIDEFIERWAGSGGSEMATAQSFAIDLTDLLGVPRPNVSDRDGDFLDYRFERPVTETHTGRKKNRRIDLYKKGHFILESKQFVTPDAKDKDTLEMFLAKDAPKQAGHGKRGTAKFDDTMMKARNQADNYARAVAREDGYPDGQQLKWSSPNSRYTCAGSGPEHSTPCLRHSATSASFSTRKNAGTS